MSASPEIPASPPHENPAVPVNSRRWWSLGPLLWLGLALGFLGLSLLAVYPAPTTLFWILAIGATEYGHWFVLGPALLLLRSVRRGSCSLPVIWVSLIACGFFLSPLVRGWAKSARLQTEICRVFPVSGKDSGTPSRSWLRLHELYLGKGAPAVSAEVVPFAEHDGDPLSFHFYRAVAQSAAPCVIVLHTGGWNGGSWDEFQAFNSHLARRGYAVAVVDYRLAPRWQWPAQRDDVLDAVRVLRERAAEFGVDPTRFVLLGRSAGGQIAEAVGYGSEFTGLRGVIAFYAPADMFLAFEYARSDDILNSLKLLRDYLGGDPAERAEVYRNASGIGLVNSASPPTLLLHGRRDELVWFRQSERLAARLTAAGVPNSLIALDWATHAFDYNPHGPGGQLSTRAVDHFLDSVTARSQRFP